MSLLYRHSVATVYDPDNDNPARRVREYKLYICCHCNVGILLIAFNQLPTGNLLKPGRGLTPPPRTRSPGFCHLCHHITCGKAECLECVPWEAKLEAMEGTRRFWKNLNLEGKKF